MIDTRLSHPVVISPRVSFPVTKSGGGERLGRAREAFERKRSNETNERGTTRPAATPTSTPQATHLVTASLDLSFSFSLLTFRCIFFFFFFVFLFQVDEAEMARAESR